MGWHVVGNTAGMGHRRTGARSLLRRLAAALSLSLACACSGPKVVEPQYFDPQGTVYVSSEFSEQQAEVVIGAIHAWRDATSGEVDLHVKIGDGAPLIRPATQRDGLIAEFTPSDPPQIVVDTGKAELAWELRNTMLHELGHALGLKHIERVESVMFPFANSVQELDPWTLQAWARLNAHAEAVTPTP